MKATPCLAVPLHSDQNGDAQREHKSHDAPGGDAQSRGARCGPRAWPRLYSQSRLAFELLAASASRQLTVVREQAEVALKLPAEHGFSFWEQHALFWRGWGLAAAGEATAGSATMRDAIESLQGMGVVNQRPFLLGLLADVCRRTETPSARRGVNDCRQYARALV